MRSQPRHPPEPAIVVTRFSPHVLGNTRVRQDQEALIRQPVEGVFRWTPEAVEAILEYSGLKPYVIQKFCIHAVNEMLEDGRSTITAADVEAVRPAVLFERAEEETPIPETASA